MDKESLKILKSILRKIQPKRVTRWIKSKKIYNRKVKFKK